MAVLQSRRDFSAGEIGSETAAESVDDCGRWVDASQVGADSE
jgi:hypothetical protein